MRIDAFITSPKIRMPRKYVLSLALLAFLVYWRWLLPGLISDQDWWNFTRAGLDALFPFPSTFDFSKNLGENLNAYINYFPILSVLGALGQLGLSSTAAERIVIMFPTVILLGVGGYYLSRQYVEDPVACVIAGIFYGYNAYINTIMARGQMTIAESYACVPFIVAFTIRAIRSPRQITDALWAALFLALSVVCDVRIAVVGVAAAAIFGLLELRRSPKIARSVLQVAVIAAVGAALLAFIWVPLLGAHVREHPPLDYLDPAWIPRLSSATFWDVLIAYKPFWFDAALHPAPLWFYLNALALAIGLIVVWRRSKTLAAAVVMLLIIGCVLSAGYNTFFGDAYVWLFKHTWVMSMYRDPSKFYLLAMLPYSICFGFTVAFARAFARGRLATIATGILAFLALAPSLPVLVMAQHQLFDPHVATSGEATLAKVISSDRRDGRVLWASAPNRQIPGDYRHPQMDGLWFASVAVGRGSTLSDAPTFLKALHVFGVRYVVIRKDVGEGLDFAPTAAARRSILIYAELGVLGKPIMVRDGLTAYRLDNQLAVTPSAKTASYRVGAYRAPPTGFADVPIHAKRLRILLIGDRIVFPKAQMQLPAGVTLEKRVSPELSYAATSNIHGTIVLPGPAVSIMAQLNGTDLPVRPGRTVEVLKPDWTSFFFVRVRTEARRRAELIVRDPQGKARALRYSFSPISQCASVCWIVVPVHDMPNHAMVTLSTGRDKTSEITVLRALDERYENIIAPNALQRARPDQWIALAIPTSAAIPVRLPQQQAQPIAGVNATPARVQFCLPHDGRSYALPFENTELLRLRYADGTVARFINADRQDELPVVVGRGCALMYSVEDQLLSTGWKVSILALLATLSAFTLNTLARSRSASKSMQYPSANVASET